MVPRLESDLSPLTVWFSENLLKLNTKKTEFVLFPKFQCFETNVSLLSVMEASSVVPSQVSARYLGLHFDSQFLVYAGVHI